MLYSDKSPEAPLAAVSDEQIQALRHICERLAAALGTIPPSRLETMTDLIASLSALAGSCGKQVKRGKQDQRELLETRHELENIERLKARFIRNVSHELRTPLASIDGFVRVLLQMEKQDCRPEAGATLGAPASSRLTDESGEKAPAPANGNGRGVESRQQFLCIISQEVQRLGKLIEDVLDLSEIEAHRKTRQPSLYSVSTIFNDAVNSMRNLPASPRISMRLKPEPDGPVMYADREAMVEVFRQLINNAHKFSGGQEIVLGAEPVTITPDAKSGASDSGLQNRVTSATRVYVKDRGIGIAKEELNRIFEKFYRVERAAMYPGTGLGLSIVHALVHQNNGQVWADSQIGRGTTFYVLLPDKPPGSH